MAKKSFPYQPPSKVQIATHQKALELRGKNKSDKRKEYQKKKFEDLRKHYLGKLEFIIDSTILLANKIQEHPDITDKEGALGELVRQKDREWKDICSKVNNTQKIIRLVPDAFKIRLHEVGTQAEQMLKEKNSEQNKSVIDENLSESKVVELPNTNKDGIPSADSKSEE